MKEPRGLHVSWSHYGNRNHCAGRAIRELSRLRRLYGPGRWRKLKGFAFVRASDGLTYRAEIHWYEASGIGRQEIKVKRFL